MADLVFYDFETVEPLTSLAIGSVAPRSSDDTMLRVYNASDTYQAQDVAVTLDGADTDQLWLSTDGDVFGVSVLLGDIPPTAASSVFYVRRVTPSTQASGPCSATLLASLFAWVAPADVSTSDNVPLDTPPEP